MITVGGNSIIPEVENNIIKITAPLDEPRRSFLAFYPDDAISQNPYKSINEIAAELDNFYSFMAEAGPCYIKSDSIVANSIITNSTTAQKEYALLLRLKDGFYEVIGISLDMNLENWVKAIQMEDLKWLHISDLQGWNNVVAKQYKISGVPSNCLIDKMGTVVGFNLSEEELDRQLSNRKYGCCILYISKIIRNMIVVYSITKGQ